LTKIEKKEEKENGSYIQKKKGEDLARGYVREKGIGGSDWNTPTSE